MNTVVGSALGGLVAGAVALGAAAVMKPSPAPIYVADPNSPYAMTVANTAPLNNGAQLMNAQPMQCQPYEETVLRRVLVNGREVTDVTCITRMGSGYAVAPYTQTGYAPFDSATVASDPRLAQGRFPYAQPVSAPQPVYRDDIVTRPVVRSAPVRRASTQEVRRESDRSWKKTAMVIGGSTGAGAGIGGLIAGKKGALIGAAVGGGAATIYESTKR